MSTTVTGHSEPAVAPFPATLRWAPLSGIATAVFFVIGVVASSPPGLGASNAAWMANYSSSDSAGHIVSGLCLVLSGLAFLLFTAGLWQHVTAGQAAFSYRPGPLPLIGAGVTAACMAVGGALMAAPSLLISHGAPTPSADLLHLCDGGGFLIVGIPGMLAAAITVVAFSVQGRRAGLFGRKLYASGIVVAVLRRRPARPLGVGLTGTAGRARDRVGRRRQRLALGRGDRAW